MFLDSFFANNKVFDCLIESKQQTKTNGVLGAETWVAVKTVPALFWRGGMAERFISAQNRALVSAVAVVKPSDIAESDIPKGGRVTLTYGVLEVGKYSIVAPDDVGGQGETIVIQLTEFKG